MKTDCQNIYFSTKSVKKEQYRTIQYESSVHLSHNITGFA